MDILSGEEASSLRQFFLCTFVDTSCDYFQDRIAHMRQFSDGLRYTGYLWDCMLDREPVSCHYLISQLQALTGPFYVFGTSIPATGFLFRIIGRTTVLRAAP